MEIFEILVDWLVKVVFISTLDLYFEHIIQHYIIAPVILSPWNVLFCPLCVGKTSTYPSSLS